jgi:tartrate dehydratase alpha subunit/fumarate hydratase class I-like protein
MATNTVGDTDIPQDALGAPLRLAYDQDGSVKFSKHGKPVIRVAKDNSDNIKMVRENFMAGLQNYANTVITENTEAYKKQANLCQDAGQPIIGHDKSKLDEAMAKMVEQALEQAESQESETGQTAETETKEKELVPA